MAKITINRENFKVEERELEQGSLKIGRKSDNHLHIDDPAVSGHHAQIVTVFDSAYVEDLGSTNGTFVNGEKIKTHTLHNGDVITIGHYQILFQAENKLSATDDPDATMMIGVSQLEALTKKARENAATLAKITAVPRPVKTPVNPASAPAPTRKQTVAVAGKPQLQVHENTTPKQAVELNNKALPDIDDRVPLLNNTQQIPTDAPRFNRRKSDQSMLPPMKIIILAVLAAIATFTVLMLAFK